AGPRTPTPLPYAPLFRSIGNTSSASALAAALLPRSPLMLVGPGTGLDHGGVRHKLEVIQQALRLHGGHCSGPLETLRRLGGFEVDRKSTRLNSSHVKNSD